MMLGKAALQGFPVVGIVVDDYESEDSRFIGFSKRYGKLSSPLKEILFRIATSAHPGASSIRFKRDN